MVNPIFNRFLGPPCMTSPSFWFDEGKHAPRFSLSSRGVGEPQKNGGAKIGSAPERMDEIH